ncbi:MAG: macro domain-containing protein [Proteobacteria bacterium]|nr:macro domain-containing protein [Pseudomonadota bacterium]
MRPIMQELIQKQQQTYNQVFLAHSKTFHNPTFHYDWWMFPVLAPSNVSEQSKKYSANTQDTKDLLNHKQFITTYANTIDKYLTNLKTYGWNKYDVRYAKMMSSLAQFITVSNTMLHDNKIASINTQLKALAKRAVSYAQSVPNASTFFRSSLSKLNSVTPKPAMPKPVITPKPAIPNTVIKPLNQPTLINPTPAAKPNNKISIDFNHGLLDNSIKTDAIVNAASTQPLAIKNWSGVAGAIYQNLQLTDKKILDTHWNKLGQQVFPGTSTSVKNAHGQPHRFELASGNKCYLIHAGSPKWIKDPKQHAQIKAKLISAYLSIMQGIQRHNQIAQYKIQTVAIPPLGIGIYQVPPQVSAQCAFAAFTEFFKTTNSKISIIIPLKDGKNRTSNDYLFGEELKKLITNQAANQPKSLGKFKK